MINRFALAAIAVLAAEPAWAQRDFSTVEISATQVREGLFMLTGAGGNIGLSVGPDGAFVIDDQFAPLSAKIKAAIKSKTDQPVEFVLNTHFHGDHTGGNEALGGGGATIVAHENVRKRLKEGFVRSSGQESPPAAEGALPIITFSDRVSFFWNGDEILVFHPAGAHTDGDAIVHFQAANVVHMGDVFFNGFYPFIDVEAGGGIDGYIAAQDAVLAKIDDNTKLIPGHGALATKADLERANAVLRQVRARVQALIDAGADEDAAVAADPLADLNGEWGQGFINGERMVRAAHQSLAK